MFKKSAKNILITGVVALGTVTGISASANAAENLGGGLTNPTPVADWSGAYAGVSLGAADSDISVLGFELDADPGFAYGGHIGYIFQQDNLVFGVEGEFGDYNSEFSTANGGATLSVETGYMMSLKARAGIAAGKNLFTLHGGIASASVDVTATNGGASQTVNAYDTGYVFGGAIERQISDRMSFGVEYSQANFDDFESPGVDVEIRSVKLRTSFKF